MDDLTADTNVNVFARALHGWVGPHAAAYAEERGMALRWVGDIAGADAWSRVAEAGVGELIPEPGADRDCSNHY
jgi:hypothetical protein